MRSAGMKAVFMADNIQMVLYENETDHNFALEEQDYGAVCFAFPLKDALSCVLDHTWNRFNLLEGSMRRVQTMALRSRATSKMRFNRFQIHRVTRNLPNQPNDCVKIGHRFSLSSDRHLRVSIILAYGLHENPSLVH